MVTNRIALVLGSDPEVALRIGEHAPDFERRNLERKPGLLLVDESTVDEIVAEHAVPRGVEKQAVIVVGMDVGHIRLGEKGVTADDVGHLVEASGPGVESPAPGIPRKIQIAAVVEVGIVREVFQRNGVGNAPRHEVVTPQLP